MIREYRPPDDAGGIGAWNDFSATANAARGALREAAGVEVPGSSFRRRLPGRLSDRARAAQLAGVPHAAAASNGPGSPRPSSPSSARGSSCSGPSSTSASCALKPRSASSSSSPIIRGHILSRYTALYTSLSTTYDLEFGNLTTLAAPFPRSRDRLPTAQRRRACTPLDFQRHDNVRLAGLPVSSNSTGMVHSEQMLPLDGPIRIGTSTAARQRADRKSLASSNCTACASCEADRAEATKRPASCDGMWIGELLPGQSVAKSRHMPARAGSEDAVCRRTRGRGASAQQRSAAEPGTDVPPGARSAEHGARAKCGSWPASTKCCRARRSRPRRRRSAAQRWSSPTCNTRRCRRRNRTTTRDAKSKPPTDAELELEHDRTAE